ncbi:hypothetical protein GCM10011418_42580 [Sphingobacterium alkalisoli]|nr:RagB/SusD family nutrient uptake outer membrane protein [Sphingobacterium alkalisoli]GGH30494.1 hypothetical protein GCM10011418_42580 [Sphingobacterium alkalisoli]
MKKHIKIFHRIVTVAALISSLLLPTSCSEWLDVKPSTQTSEREQFSSEQGFINALIGAYQRMASSVSYGKELSYGMIDVFAQVYENKSSETDGYGIMARYNFLAAPNQTLISSIWQHQYNIIAQANYILKNVDEQRHILHEHNYEIIKGEALAIRALVHFDLLRLFAPALAGLDQVDQPTIPYMTDFTISPKKAASFQSVIDAIVRDLVEAEALLVVNPEIDQIQDNEGSISLDVFGMYRQNRLNYWAVKGLLARVHLYGGNNAQALKYAKEVIGSDKFAFVNALTYSTEPNSTKSNTIFSNEHIFSIYKSDLKNLSDDLFKTEVERPESLDLFTSVEKLKLYYEEGAGSNSDDTRGIGIGKRWNEFSESVVYSTKYYVGVNINNVNQKLVPVLRLPEMYYIATEASGTIEEALAFLNVVRNARLISVLTTDIITTAEQLENELFKEYRKEFYAEGQLWYYYKRKNYLNLENSVGGVMNNEKYVLPKPNDEIEFGLN